MCRAAGQELESNLTKLKCDVIMLKGRLLWQH